MREDFTNIEGKIIVDDLIRVIEENRMYLSEIDGAIGDGDHGINMAKGFLLARERIQEGASLSDALKVLSRVLMTEIGGSMGPLYGGFFKGMSVACRDKERIDKQVLGQMLESAYNEIKKLSQAKVGDKTLVDTLDPAINAYRDAIARGESFYASLNELVEAAEKGKESTRDLVAKLGRSARLGERSKGVLDTGAVSCFLILQSIRNSITSLIGDK